MPTVRFLLLLLTNNRELCMLLAVSGGVCFVTRKEIHTRDCDCFTKKKVATAIKNKNKRDDNNSTAGHH